MLRFINILLVSFTLFCITGFLAIFTKFSFPDVDKHSTPMKVYCVVMLISLLTMIVANISFSIFMFKEMLF